MLVALLEFAVLVLQLTYQILMLIVHFVHLLLHRKELLSALVPRS